MNSIAISSEWSLFCTFLHVIFILVVISPYSLHFMINESSKFLIFVANESALCFVTCVSFSDSLLNKYLSAFNSSHVSFKDSSLLLSTTFLTLFSELSNAPFIIKHAFKDASINLGE